MHEYFFVFEAGEDSNAPPMELDFCDHDDEAVERARALLEGQAAPMKVKIFRDDRLIAQVKA